MPNPIPPWEFRHGSGGSKNGGMNALNQKGNSESNADEIVYTAAAGKKYHRGGCSYLRKSKTETQITLGAAVASGYQPCSRCNPPILGQESTSSTGSASTSTESTSSSTSSDRTIYTGPRGGKYYINSKGNKTYIKKKK